MPVSPPPIYISGFGEKSVKLAARIGDGYVCVQPNADFVRLYRESGGGDRPVQGGLKVCWGTDEAKARATMHRLWPTDAIPGEAMQLLPTPRHFGELVPLISEDMIEAACGPDPAEHAGSARAFTDAGFDEVSIGQVGGALVDSNYLHAVTGWERSSRQGTRSRWRAATGPSRARRRCTSARQSCSPHWPGASSGS